MKTNTSKEIIDLSYEEYFETAYEDIKQTVFTVKNYSVSDLEAYLENLYVIQGNDQLGRGRKMDMINAATIAACELYLVKWKSELGM